MKFLILSAAVLLIVQTGALAQVPPSATEEAGYRGLHAAAAQGDVALIRQLAGDGADLEARDGAGRTALHVAAFKSHDAALEALVTAGADINALEHAAYDVITIAAVADDLELLTRALNLGGNPANITSPYEGTALIAAAHLGHAEVVSALVEAGAPLDHVNNLGWTALIEVVVLGDGGPRHRQAARALLAGGADRTIADRQGVTPLQHAEQAGYGEMVALFKEMAR
ncbi:MAG: ankyrin repeat domain-containing protein [Rhodospirillales bacterium]|nr:ankyrin repeat domain-containing protein [Rhodospirillales bacterium]